MATTSAPSPAVTTAPAPSRESAPWRMAVKLFITRHPVLTYYALAFTISWGGVLLVVGGPGGIPGTAEQFKRLLPFAIPALLAGPSVAGILLTGLVSGRAGFRELLSRLLRWRVGARWYAVALLTAPFLMTAGTLALSLISPVFLPNIVTTSDRASLLLFGIAWGLIVGFFEELGWTGFAMPRLRRRHGVLTTGLLMGVLWGAWHVLTNDLWGGAAYSGGLPLALFLTGSLLVAMLMHASLTACTLILSTSATGLAFLTYGLVVAVAQWGLVAAVAAGQRRAARIATAPEANG
jgi:uncharacterized protein